MENSKHSHNISIAKILEYAVLHQTLKTVLFLAVVTNPSVLFGYQINESHNQNFQLNAKATGNYQKGNVNILTLKGTIDFTVRPSNNWVFKSENSQLYQEFSKRKADNNTFSRNYLYHKPEKKFYPFGIAYVSTNFRRKIRLRYFAGAGITYKAIAIEKVVLKFALNTVYEASNFKTTIFNIDAYNGSDNIDLWRGTVYIGGWSALLKKKLRFSYEGFYQPAFKDFENYRTQLNLELSIPISKGLFVSVNYNYTHENVMPLNIEEDDTYVTLGLGYTFKSQEK